MVLVTGAGLGANHSHEQQDKRMQAIIIAAGTGTRLAPLTRNRPKCMLEIGGRPILQRLADRLAGAGIGEVTVIRGYLAHRVTLPGARFVENRQYASNNILHSLMTARGVLEAAARSGETVVVSYADIVFDASVLDRLLASPSPLALVVDTDWQSAYGGRTDHPPAEAEAVRFDEERRVRAIAKNLFEGPPPSGGHGEFIGLWKCAGGGAEALLGHFDRIDRALGPDDPFRTAARWQEAYLTDLFQEMIDGGEAIDAVTVSGGWMEIDTEQDYHRARARWAEAEG